MQAEGETLVPGLVAAAIPTVDLRSPSRASPGIAMPRALLTAPTAPLNAAASSPMRAPPPVQQQVDPATTTDDLEVSESGADDETE